MTSNLLDSFLASTSTLIFEFYREIQKISQRNTLCWNEEIQIIPPRNPKKIRKKSKNIWQKSKQKSCWMTSNLLDSFLASTSTLIFEFYREIQQISQRHANNSTEKSKKIRKKSKNIWKKSKQKSCWMTINLLDSFLASTSTLLFESLVVSLEISILFIFPPNCCWPFVLSR